jgi:hypothetical protein
MKTAKEKAIELVDEMSSQTYEYQEYAGARYTTCEVGYQAGKKCALIAVDETIKALNVLLNSGLNNDFDILKLRGEYMELKSEIEKL